MSTMSVNSFPVACSLRVLVPPQDETAVSTILRHCFPENGADQRVFYCSGASEDEDDADYEDAPYGALNYVPPVKSPGATRVFRAERVPILEVQALSLHMPESEFSLTYECPSTDHGESTGAGLVVFLAGEIVRHEGESAVGHAGHSVQPIGTWWLRSVAETILRSAFSVVLSRVEGGEESCWKETMSMNLDFSAFEHLQRLLSPGDRQILNAVEAAYRVKADVARHRRTVANAAVAIGSVLKMQSESGTVTCMMSSDEVQQLATAEKLLREVAGGVPAMSEAY